jgi:hypothetical protein
MITIAVLTGGNIIAVGIALRVDNLIARLATAQNAAQRATAAEMVLDIRALTVAP